MTISKNKIIGLVLFAVMSMFSTSLMASQTCVPTTVVTEGDLFAGGTISFAVTSGAGTVTIDHIDAGTGLVSLTQFGAAVNAKVSIEKFTVGTYDAVVVRFDVINPTKPVDFGLRAASTYHSIFIEGIRRKRHRKHIVICNNKHRSNTSISNNHSYPKCK